MTVKNLMTSKIFQFRGVYHNFLQNDPTLKNEEENDQKNLNYLKTLSDFVKILTCFTFFLTISILNTNLDCVKTTDIQQKTIDSIQTLAELCILSGNRMVAGIY